MNLQTGVQDVADLIAAAAVHQVASLGNDQFLAAAVLTAQHIGDLQCAAAVAGVQHHDLAIFQIGLDLRSNAAVSVRGGNDHHHVYIRHNLLDAVGNDSRLGLALDDAGDLNGIQLLKTVNLLLINIIQSGGIALVGQNGGHTLSASAGTDDCKLQHHVYPPV